MFQQSSLFVLCRGNPSYDGAAALAVHSPLCLGLHHPSAALGRITNLVSPVRRGAFPCRSLGGHCQPQIEIPHCCPASVLVLPHSICHPGFARPSAEGHARQPHAPWGGEQWGQWDGVYWVAWSGWSALRWSALGRRVGWCTLGWSALGRGGVGVWGCLLKKKCPISPSHTVWPTTDNMLPSLPTTKTVLHSILCLPALTSTPHAQREFNHHSTFLLVPKDLECWHSLRN